MVVLILGYALALIRCNNYRFLTTETNFKALYIFCCLLPSKSIYSECTDSQNLSHFENESTFRKRTTF